MKKRLLTPSGAQADKETLSNWADGTISTARAMFQIKLNNGAHEDIFEDENDFRMWARSIGWRRPDEYLF